MTSAELKHRAKLQEWSARIQDCRSSGLSVRARYHATLRNVPRRLHIGNASLDIYPGCDTEQLKMLVELLRLC
ncbi:MAG: hypothetical protein V8T01_06290 [Oscillospiraceae bacterium]